MRLWPEIKESGRIEGRVGSGLCLDLGDWLVLLENPEVRLLGNLSHCLTVLMKKPELRVEHFLWAGK